MLRFMLSFADFNKMESTYEKDLKQSFWVGFSVGVFALALSILMICLYCLTGV